MFRRMLVVLTPGAAVAAVQCMLPMAVACRAAVVFFTGLAPDEARAGAGQLHEHARRLAESFGLESRSLLADAPHAVDGILDAAAECGCDLIAVCHSGGNAVVRLMTGDHIPRLITASALPVLVCSPRFAVSASPGVEVRRILVALESGEAAGPTVAHGLEIARALGADLVFTHIAPSQTVLWVDVDTMIGGAVDRVAEAIREQSRRMLAASVARAEQAGLSAQSIHLPPGSSARDLAAMATSQACDLVLMAHPQGNAMVRLISGSLVPGLISASSTPILIGGSPERGAFDHSALQARHLRPPAPGADSRRSHR